MSRLLVCALVAASGCHWSLNDAGTEPLPAQLYFPSGLAVDSFQGQAVLFVSNANADLHYGGGTVMVVDLNRFDQALRAFPGCEGAATCANTDVGLCKRDPLDPQVVDCDESAFILGDATVKVGNFAGSIIVQNQNSDPKLDDGHRRLFVGVRGDPSITWIDVDYSKLKTPLGLLDCFDNPGSLMQRPGYNSSTKHNTAPPACDGSHLVQAFNETMVGCDQKAPSSMCSMMVNLPPEPFGLFLDEDPGVYHRLLVSHLAGGEVTLLDVSGAPMIQTVSQQFFAADPNMRHGAFSLAPQRRGAGAHTLWYMTSDIQAQLALFRVADAPAVVPQGNVQLLGLAGGNDVRQIVFQPDGARAFMTDNQPPSVVVLDTRVTATSGGLPVNQLVDQVNVCQEPSRLMWQQLSGPGPIGAAPNLQTRLFVVCFLANQVMLVDPDLPGVLDTIVVGRGPAEVVYHEDENFSPKRRAYVSNFGEWTISVIDLDPGSMTQNRVVARIGLPNPPPSP
jgi:hypothetical protein